MNTRDVEDWFVREVLPLEASLTHFLRRNWRKKDEIPPPFFCMNLPNEFGVATTIHVAVAHERGRMRKIYLL